ncbi:MAG: hypothetical protein A2Z27_00285 [candidate division Zixibacteria bacterium RBG_16_50_21]|nr:MAG: hypothetical protein A2Z27_00285 [candidate division Zixibacteria bacterium RBG_16_50_21]
MQLTRDKIRKAIRDPVYFAREFLGVEPHEGQAKWLQNSVGRENALHTGNRWGKSFVQAVKFLHRCLFKIRKSSYRGLKYQAANVSITGDQAQIIYYHILGLVNKSKLVSHLVKDALVTPFPHIIFGNQAVFWARSTQNNGEYLLGHDYDFINFDEAAYETNPDYVIDQVLVMRLADREGTLDLTSTPKGRNWFYRKCQQLENNPHLGYVQNGDCGQNPHISKEYLEYRKETLSEKKVAQNMYGRFVDEENVLIKEEQLAWALANSTGLCIPLAGHSYVSGWDLGRKQSWTVGITVDISVRPFQVVSFERFQKDWLETAEIIRQKKKLYPGLVVFDSTGIGDVIMSELADIRPIGFHFGEKGGKAKLDLISNLQLMHLKNQIAYPLIEQFTEKGQVWSLQDELRELSWDSKESLDGAMALALALWPLRKSVEDSVILSPQIANFP